MKRINLIIIEALMAFFLIVMIGAGSASMACLGDPELVEESFIWGIATIVSLLITLFLYFCHERITQSLKRKEWINKYIGRIQERCSDVSNSFAKELAEASLENIKYDLTECPVEMANEEISCWSD